jgi:alpha-N-arabinofuranosidase
MAQLVNVIAPMMTNQNSLVLQTTYYPLKLYTEHGGDIALDVLVRSDAFPQFADTPYLDVSATTTDSRGKFTLAVVNRNPASDIAADVAVEGFNIPSTADSYELNGAAVDASNTFATPNAVGVRRKQASGLGQKFSYTFPAHSLTVITMGS